jgi:hypothetical protein
MSNESTEGSQQPYEGRFTMEGGDIMYRANTETDPAAILKGAQVAAEKHGGYDNLGRRNLHVVIPGRGEYQYDEHTTLADFEEQDKRKEARSNLASSIIGLSAAEIAQVTEYAKTLRK